MGIGGFKYFTEMPLCMSRSNIEMSEGTGVLTILKSTGQKAGID